MSEKQVFHNIIDGEVQASASGAMMDIINPSTGEVYASAPNSDARDVDQAFQAADRAFEKWRWSTPSERQRALLKLADVIEENAEELVAIESENTGKPVALTMSEEIPPMVDQIRFFAGAARVLEGKATGEYMRGFTSSIRREPVGPVAQVAPWNYPMMMSVWKFAPALAAGNTVVLKPSDTTPASSYWMVEKMQEIFPPGVCNLVCGDRDTGAALTAHPTPQLVSITGSTRAGIAVATAAAAGPQARPPRARRQGAGGRLRRRRHRGWRSRASPPRATSTPARTALQQPASSLREALRRVPLGTHRRGQGTKTGYDPNDEDILYGPINNTNQLEHIKGLVDRAPRARRVLTGGQPAAATGLFYEPTLSPT